MNLPRVRLFLKSSHLCHHTRLPVTITTSFDIYIDDIELIVLAYTRSLDLLVPDFRLGTHKQIIGLLSGAETLFLSHAILVKRGLPIVHSDCL